MKTIYLCFLVFCFHLIANANFLNDSIAKKPRRSIEIKSSAVLFFKGKSGDSNNDRVVGVPSESFNLSIGKNFNSFSCGINLDYTKFNVTGQPKIVGWDSHTKVNITKYRFLIRQNVKFSYASFGFTPRYNYEYKKLIMDYGAGIYFSIYRHIVIVNHYEGEQTNYYSGNGPTADKEIKDEDNNRISKAFISYFGPTFNIGYRINKYFGLKFCSAFYYTFMENITGDTFEYPSLPKQSIYTIRKEWWLTSGVGLVFNY